MSPVLSTFSGASARAFGFGYNFVSSAFEHIETQTVGAGGAASITFSSIPGTYKHLQIRGVTRTARANADDNLQIQFNSDATGANYAFHTLYGTGTSAVSFASTNTSYTTVSTAANSTSNVFAGGVIDILDYANSSKYKTVRALSGFDGNGSGVIYFASTLWENTNAITSLTIAPVTAINLVQHTSFSLYGLR